MQEHFLNFLTKFYYVFTSISRHNKKIFTSSKNLEKVWAESIAIGLNEFKSLLVLNLET
jgi:hypothetical protein